MLARHKFVYTGNFVSVRGIEAYLYDCIRCECHLRFKDPYPLPEIAGLHKIPGCLILRDIR